MRSRAHRLWRVAMWVGFATSAIIVAAFIVSIWWQIGWGWASGDFVALRHGHIGFGRTLGRSGPINFRIYNFIATLQQQEWFEFHPPYSGSDLWYLQVPLWSLQLLVGGATVLAWRRARSRGRAGSCRQCGYSLAGLPAGAPCPECGHASPLPIQPQSETNK